MLEKILIPVFAFILLGALMGALLALASKLFAVEKNETAEQISSLLPGANCGGCGFSGCAAFAEALSKGEAKPNGCSVADGDAVREISSILGVEAEAKVKMRAQVMCSGNRDLVKKKYIYDGILDCAAASKIGGGDRLCEFGCVGLGTCVRACPFGAISVVDGVAAVDYKKCTGCGVCTNVCPKHLIALIPYEAKHWVGCKNNEIGKETRQKCEVGCISCKICEKNCPTGAIKVNNFLAEIDYDKCNGCGVCAQKCPRDIIWSAEKQGLYGLKIKRI